MFDVALVLLFARALLTSAHRRFAAGLLLTTSASLLWFLLAAAGWYGRAADEMRLTGALILVFLGPSAVPAPTAKVPWSAQLAQHPIGAKVIIALLFAAAFRIAWLGALRFSPLSDEASARKKLGLVFLANAILVTLQVICLELTAIVT